MGQKRIVEIIKALSVDAKILLLDEPTTGMSRVEIETLFKIMEDLKSRNITMIYISHILEEIYSICDRITVLRDGINAATYNIEEVDTNTLVKTMIGREVKDEFPDKRKIKIDEILLEVTDFQTTVMKKSISFKLNKGEILGITGIIGAGKSELGHALFGVDKKISGEIKLNGISKKFKTPSDAKNNGIALIPEDRKSQGLFLEHTVQNNVVVSYIEKLNSNKLILSIKNIEKRLDDLDKTLDEYFDEFQKNDALKYLDSFWDSTSKRILFIDRDNKHEFEIEII